MVLGGLPHDAVRRVSHDARWLTLGRNGGGRRFIAVDLDPGPAGTAGQLFCYEIGPSGWPVELVAGSVTALLRRFVDAAGGRDSTTPAWVHGAEEATYTGRPDGPWPVDSVTRLAAADDVQHCVLGGCPHIDLAGCAPLSRLRVLQVRDVQTVELALPHRVPVESLMVSAPAVDLTGLSGHPSIWDLTVSGTGAPVSIAPLATLPELARLDLSGVDVPDLELVVGLPRLRVLVLDAGQWARLRDLDAIPVGLAAAELAGNNTFEVEIEWSAAFGVSAGPRRLLRGSL
ncbi:hypothetical protein [Actinocatenispora sera]|uniref:Leucine-rich repeat domain-containing protein n=1 Tax=Actinocatenispora sera TaxID=390989 RepID=A0A810KU64_9ACTN|nr:hypothetical protein [Actinocatenispora sera]BCJ26002.1 hypothetical protein Asera_01100 [Actinocatenispora sera]